VRVNVDLDLAALTSAAGQALVQAMASDGWTAVRDRVARMFGRGDHRRAEDAMRALEEAHGPGVVPLGPV
jgi:hypothetical protein